jgi:hypothetical protein
MFIHCFNRTSQKARAEDSSRFGFLIQAFPALSNDQIIAITIV